MKTLFITYGDINVASSRMRAYWVAPYMKDATVQDSATSIQVDNDYDNIIFQKWFNTELARSWKNQGKRIYYDACDPVWWWQPQEVKEFLYHVDGVVCSNEDLVHDFRDWNKFAISSKTICDRLELSHFPILRKHEEVSPVKLIWFGHPSNQWTINSIIPNLQRLEAEGFKIEFTIYGDWKLEEENAVIASHDIAVLPSYPGPWGEVKSNNKTLTAWACGLPVTNGENYNELVELVMLSKYRQECADVGYKTLINLYQVEKSAQEWEVLLNA
jgi:glycosyltransferase involved in cell wall biosynthesis